MDMATPNTIHIQPLRFGIKSTNVQTEDEEISITIERGYTYYLQQKTVQCGAHVRKGCMRRWYTTLGRDTYTN